jgi:hypothetical protein
MAKSLIDRLRASRRLRVESAGKVFHARRPTDLEAMALDGRRIGQRELVTQFVEGWEGITESDLIAGGSDAEVPFAADLYAEYIADHPEHWPAIADKVMAAYVEYRNKREEAEKNSLPGSAG